MMEPEEDIVQMTYGGTTLEAPKVLADIVESIAAAVYFDCDSDLQLFWTVNCLSFPIATVASGDNVRSWAGFQGHLGADHHAGDDEGAPRDDSL